MFPFFVMDQTRHLIIIVQRDVDKEQKYESQKYLQKLIRNYNIITLPSERQHFPLKAASTGPIGYEGKILELALF